MSKSANDVLAQAKSWLGFNEGDGSHKKIIDVYNAHKPLARSYAVRYTDEWCATFVSAVAIKVGCTDIIPTECGCQQMIELFKKLNAWVENEATTPKPGWIIFYDWQDAGSGDNQGYADHVGIVEKVEGGKVTIIEGNYSNSVKRRVLDVNARYVRGYGAPKYAENVAASTVDNTKYRIQIDAMFSKKSAEDVIAKLKAAGVSAVMKACEGSSSDTASVVFKVGDKVKLTAGAPLYGKAYGFASWVYNSTLYVREINGSKIVISTFKTGDVTGAVDKKYLTKV